MKTQEQNINFIRHFVQINELFREDTRLNPFHISLYNALFLQWNQFGFQNQISICREELMSMSKIGSANTYTKILKELNEFGYISYKPSFNRIVGSKIILYRFDKASDKATDIGSDKASDKASVMPMRPSINYNKQIKHNKTNINTNSIELVNTQNENEENFVFKKEADAMHQDFQNPKVKNPIPKNLEEVEAYFLEKEKPKSEANKFFNFYEANGWMVGKNKMKNWRAAANNWMANIGKYNSKPQNEKTTYLHVDQDKDYSVPL